MTLGTTPSFEMDFEGFLGTQSQHSDEGGMWSVHEPDADEGGGVKRSGGPRRQSGEEGAPMVWQTQVPSQPESQSSPSESVFVPETPMQGRV